MLTALLIMLREGFEAALVVAIVYAYIRRIGRRDLVAPMWRGMAAAAALSVAAGGASGSSASPSIACWARSWNWSPRERTAASSSARLS